MTTVLLNCYVYHNNKKKRQCGVVYWLQSIFSNLINRNRFYNPKVYIGAICQHFFGSE